MSSDHYSTLGVSPSAERVAIGAAYRALMRHYHPDSNPDPEAHARARAITAAYAVLRDPAKRAKYDAELREGDVWRSVELPPRPIRPPAGRTAGMAAAALAILMIGAALILPSRQQPVPRLHGPVAEKEQATSASAPSRPLTELEPEVERLADLTESGDLQPAVPPPEVPIEQVRTEPLPAPISVREVHAMPQVPTAPPPAAARNAPPPGAMPQVHAQPSPPPVRSLREARVSPVQRTAKPARPQLAEARHPPPPVPAPRALAQASKPAGPRSAPSGANSDRVATLERISAGFYTQSLQHADAAKKQLLLSVRVRQTYQRSTCRSDSCVADSYLRQIREVSAIMENRASARE